MHTDPKVLACVDQSPYADHVTDAAAWAATRLGAPLELLHVIDREQGRSHTDDHSGAIGINAQENLLNQLAEDDAMLARQAREQGRVFLNRLRARAQAAGVAEPDMRQRHGSLVETLTEQQANVRMVVMGRRGESARTTLRDLGRHVEQVVRAMERPILTVTDGFVAPRQILIAYDGGSAARQLEAAQSALVAAGFETHSYQVMGDPETAIARAIEQHGIDMLIMGAYTHSPLRSLFVGSKTTDLLRASRVPTLLLP